MTDAVFLAGLRAMMRSQEGAEESSRPPSARTLRCIAHGQDGHWEALCLDLDIAVQGDSFDEVYASLNEAIALYFESVSALPAADRRRLLERSAPLRVRLEFVWQVIRAQFAGRIGVGQHHLFTLPAAA